MFNLFEKIVLCADSFWPNPDRIYFANGCQSISISYKFIGLSMGTQVLQLQIFSILWNRTKELLYYKKDLE
jgi:hypothetical protein